MTIIAVRGILNADYLAFDNSLKLINVQFSNNSQFTRFRNFFARTFPEVEGPTGPAHATYHQTLRASYDSQLTMPPSYNTDVGSEHSHFSYISDANLAENLMYLCQVPKFGHICIRCLGRGAPFEELLSRIQGNQIPLRGFDSVSTGHRFDI